MKALLYISQIKKKAAELRKSLEGSWSVEYHTLEGEIEFDKYFGIVLDCDQDSGVSSDRRKGIALDCRRAELPLYLSTSRPEAVSQIAASSQLISGVISYPFNKREVIELLRKKASDRLEPNIDDKLRYFIKATMEVLRTLAGENSSCVSIRSEGKFQQFGSICGMMEITGALQKRVAVSLDMDFAAILSRKIIGSDSEELSDSDLGDVAGELINQITSVVRTKLWKDDYRFDIDLPTVYVDSERIAAAASDKKWQSAVIQAENHSLMIQMSIGAASSDAVDQSPSKEKEAASKV